jgi:hypothetical protein
LTIVIVLLSSCGDAVLRVLPAVVARARQAALASSAIGGS